MDRLSTAQKFLSLLLICVVLFPIALKYVAILVLLITAARMSLANAGTPNNKSVVVDKQSLKLSYQVSFSLVVLMLLSIIWSPADAELGLNHVSHYAVVLLPLFYIDKVPTHWYEQAYHYIPWVAFCSGFLFLLVFLGFADYMPKLFEGYALYEGNRSIAVASATVVLAGVCFIQGVSETRWFACYKFYIAIFVFTVFSLTSTSRVSLIMVFGTLALSCIYLFIEKAYGRILVPFTIAMILGFVTVNNSVVIDKFARASVEATDKGGQKFDARVELYTLTLELIRDRSIFNHLAGDGAGSWNVRYPEIADGARTQKMTTAHNDFLQILMQNGVLGLVLFVSVFLSWLYAILKSCKDYRVPLFVLGCVSVMALVHAGMRDTKLASTLIIIFVISFAANLRYKRE